MEVLLDTNFIMTCMRKRINILRELYKKGFKIRVPHEVWQELKDKYYELASHDERARVTEALHVLNRKNVPHIAVGSQRVSDWLIQKGNEGYYIATTSSIVKRSVPRLITIDDKTGQLTAMERTS